MPPPAAAPSPVWTRWLGLASLAVMAFGLVIVVAPSLTRSGFALLVHGNTARMAAFGQDALAYISLVHAVLGAVLSGWGLTMWLIVRGPFSRGESWAWRAVALPLCMWFVPDTAYSLWSGFWQNAVFNTLFLLLFAVPLLASFPAFRARAH